MWQKLNFLEGVSSYIWRKTNTAFHKKNIIPTVKHDKKKNKHCTVGTESIQTPLNFSLFVILQPFAKII